MSSTITCPQCNHHFEPTAAMERAIQEKFEADFQKKKDEANARWLEQKKKQDEEVSRREEKLRMQAAELESARRRYDEDFKRKLEEECKAREKEITHTISEKLSGSFEAKMKHLEEIACEKDEELKAARKRELEFLRKEEELNRRSEELELEKQRSLREERQRITEDLRKQADEKEAERQRDFAMRQKEWEVKFEQQARLLEEAQRKAQQGSMQLQGEAQELALEELLRAAFPFDKVSEVPKGINGADCILTVRNKFMQDCGCILFESKRTQAFNDEWITKLKKDMIPCNASLAIIVTQVLPKDMERFGERQGVYVCSFMEVRALVEVLRGGIMQYHELRKSQENKGDKMERLYEYLTSSEFMQKWNIMRENFQAFRTALNKEHDAYMKNHAKKMRMLQTVIDNSGYISGDFESIAGMASLDWSELPEERALLLE